MIEGIGIDIIELDRVEQAVGNPRFRDRVFTPAEQEYCGGCVGPERYAGRFAAKEAIAKALSSSLRWKDVEILRAPSGAPLPRLHGRAAELLAGRQLLLSISHCRTYAVAQAMVLNCLRETHEPSEQEADLRLGALHSGSGGRVR